jgi:hypothetical protein
MDLLRYILTSLTTSSPWCVAPIAGADGASQIFIAEAALRVEVRVNPEESRLP